MRCGAECFAMLWCMCLYKNRLLSNLFECLSSPSLFVSFSNEIPQHSFFIVQIYHLPAWKLFKSSIFRSKVFLFSFCLPHFSLTNVLKYHLPIHSMHAHKLNWPIVSITNTLANQWAPYNVEKNGNEKQSAIGFSHACMANAYRLCLKIKFSNKIYWETCLISIYRLFRSNSFLSIRLRTFHRLNEVDSSGFLPDFSCTHRSSY